MQSAQIVTSPFLADIADPLLVLRPLGCQLLMRDLDRVLAERDEARLLFLGESIRELLCGLVELGHSADSARDPAGLAGPDKAHK